ncbi:hypothetical protein FQN52_005467 [Onygenales sp. PD_12]|nr:hypothetical protein FQN52_005467 [Onygenales sp. PD_12]
MSGFVTLSSKHALRIPTRLRLRPLTPPAPTKPSIHFFATRHRNAHGHPPDLLRHASRTQGQLQDTPSVISMSRKRNQSTLSAGAQGPDSTVEPALFARSISDDVAQSKSEASLSDAPIDLEPGTARTPASTSKTQAAGVFDPEANGDVPVDVEEVKEALSRPPPVNSSYLPLPWKGRLGYACLNTYLRTSDPPVFSSRTCRIASILENRHPLKDASQPAHRTKNRPDRDQPPDVALGLAYVQALGLANARDVVKMLRWNNRYGIRFMRLSSEIFPFASHAEHGYPLEPFAKGVLEEVGRVAGELGHRLTTHPGQFTQLASPRASVIENSIRDLEYHAEMLRLLKFPPQLNRDAVMILHMGGVFGDKQATLERFRENYKPLSEDIKNRLVLENDDVSWTVHDLLPICEELNIPLVLDYHHHNINFDASKIREGTLDIMNLYDRIAATWTRKGITQKMHYSEQTPAAITKTQRRKHNPRVQMLPPCDPTMDLMIEAKDKEQAVFDLMRTYKLPGFEKINEVIPFTRTDTNNVKRARAKKTTATKKKASSKRDSESEDEIIAPVIVPEEEVGMGGPEGRVYWPPGMEQWLQPEKKATKLEIAETIVAKTGSGNRRKRSRKAKNSDVEDESGGVQAGSKTTKSTAVEKAPVKRRRAKKAEPVSSSSEDEELPSVDLSAEGTSPPKTPSRASRRTKGKKKVDYAEREESPGVKLRTTFSFLRFLFPHTRQRVRARFLDFRHDILPAFRQRTHLRVYRAIVERQRIRRLKQIAAAENKRAPGFLSSLLSQRKSRKGVGFGTGFTDSRSSANSRFSFSYRNRQLLGASSRRLKDEESVHQMTTPQSGPSGPYRTDSGSDSSYGYGQEAGRERGTRRRKVYGYLKAANELRQAYSAQWAQKSQEYDDDYARNTPGGFPDVESARFGDEEMVLFPSYGRRHVRQQPEVDYRQFPPEVWIEDPDDPSSTGQLEYWKREWEKYEQDNAIVDIDVRGWIYAPHRGPMNRKNRILISLARRLSGIPAPSAVTPDNRPSNASMNEEAVIEKQEQSIINRVQRDADPELRPGSARGGNLAQSRTDTDQSLSITQDEISAANAQLMERLRPFLTNPMISIPITVFFFNDKRSQSRTVSTNDGGHFSVRAALDFVPTHIRVLASENLSATEEVKIIEPKGISLISDIDDTIKHSAIASGAKEIFRNTFVRNLSDLTVLGVKEWYSKLADMGVRVHYVSNSPWQLYPLLKSFFAMAGLPPGSFHLKQYSGMLQGLFEPTAEKKKPTLERIMLDFPERQFILVGDSGEADLETYTDLVVANPGKILGIFIRDVTTPHTSKFFDKSFSHLERPLSQGNADHSPPERSDEPETRPSLPPRKYLERKEPEKDDVNAVIGNLIDLDIEDEPSTMTQAEKAASPASNRQAPPLRPSKPVALRSGSVETSENKDVPLPSTSIKRKLAPPLPQKPQSLSTSQIQGQQSPFDTKPPPPARTSTNQSLTNSEESYTSAVRNKVVNIYNQLPSARSYWEPQAPPPPHGASSLEPPHPSHSKQPPPPIPPPRRSTTNQTNPKPPQSYSQSQPQLLPTSSPAPHTGTDTPIPPAPLQQQPYSYPTSTSSSPGPAPVPNKREEMWRRRWERAQEILDRQGVVLASWRVGDDVRDICVRLVERAERETDEKVRR